MKTHMIE